MKVNFYLHNVLDTAGRAALYIRYSHDSKDFRAPIKYPNQGGIIRIKPRFWIKSYNYLQAEIKSRKASKKDMPFRVKVDHPLAKAINRRLDEIEQEIYSICNDLLVYGKTPFVNEVKERYKSQNKKADIWSIWGRFMDQKKQTSKERTIINFESFGKELRRFEQVNKIDPNKLDSDFLLKFRHFLSDNGNAVSSIAVKIQRFKTFLYWAHDHEFIHSNKFKRWKIENQKAIHSALTPHEIRQITNLDPPKRLVFAKDVLLFSCFTGLRRGEIESLTEGNEIKGILTFETGKTKGKAKVLRSVKINALSLPIWQRLKRNPIYISPTDVSNMKKVAKLAQINEMVDSRGEKIPKWKDVSPNTGRRTFITLSYQFGIPENFISLIVGHKGKGMTAHYDKTQINKSFIFMDKWAESYFSAII